MDSVINVAYFVFHRYRVKFNKTLDEMKLHQLLYLAQRESIVQINKPLFKEEFEGWKFGPVCTTVRIAYKRKEFKNQSNFVDVSKRVSEYCRNVVNSVIRRYGEKESWSLNSILCKEHSWLQSREGFKDGENGSRVITLDSIRVDADHIRERRKNLRQVGDSPCIVVPIIDATALDEDFEVVDIAKEVKKIKKLFSILKSL